jgi:hypothetical protein
MLGLGGGWREGTDEGVGEEEMTGELAFCGRHHLVTLMRVLSQGNGFSFTYPAKADNGVNHLDVAGFPQNAFMTCSKPSP